jgi:hypothetical protein
MKMAYKPGGKAVAASGKPVMPGKAGIRAPTTSWPRKRPSTPFGFGDPVPRMSQQECCLA